MGNINEKLTIGEIKKMFPICNKCKNHLDGLRCKAFSVIPDSILFGENNHSKPIPNQKNNIVFEPLSKKK
jgi:hypothetical protein